MRRYIKLLLMILTTLIVIPLQFIWMIIPGLRNRFWVIPRLWHITVSRIIGTHIKIIGKKNLPKNQTVLYVANHCSYFDIVVFGTFLSGGFIAKSDVADWPVFGFLAKLQGTFFVKRNAKHIKQQKKDLIELAQNGTNFMLFPEGTTTDGMYVMPFKSSLFSIATDLGINVQPIALRYKKINKKKFTHNNKSQVAWYIDKETGFDPDLAPHLWNLLSLKSIEVEIKILPAIKTADFTHRKDLANHAQAMIANEFK